VEIEIIGEINLDVADRVRDQLRDADPAEQVVVYLCSHGGDFLGASRIANALERHPGGCLVVGRTEVISAAAVIWLMMPNGCRELEPDCTFKVHQARFVDFRLPVATTDLLERFVDVLRSADEVTRVLLAARSGMSEGEATELMLADRLMTRDEVVSLKLLYGPN
jgi:ATP-dependent protease ClpP protease subunit